MPSSIAGYRSKKSSLFSFFHTTIQSIRSHVGESSPVSGEQLHNDTLAGRETIVAIAERLQRLGNESHYYRLTSGLCVKVGNQADNETAVLQFIAANTGIPVPKVLYSFAQKGRHYTVRSTIDGVPLWEVWHTLSDSSRRIILSQVKTYVQMMRSLGPEHPGAVSGLNSTPFHHPRLPASINGIGPFNSVSDFHSFLRAGVQHGPDLSPAINQVVAMHERKRYATCFTHGDLSCWNVLVAGDTVVGVVGWEAAGWFPTYWEYVRAKDARPGCEWWGDIG
ncbi:hypothetical protein MMC28_007436 [Mycoblastus sanguinarius]|nr:hypothetical protein [Mycoblastus sanguinarius]